MITTTTYRQFMLQASKRL